MKKKHRRHNPKVPSLKNPFNQLYTILSKEGTDLVMGDWHTCKTTHCVAGWIVRLAGKAGTKLEKHYLELCELGSLGDPPEELAAIEILKASGYKISSEPRCDYAGVGYGYFGVDTDTDTDTYKAIFEGNTINTALFYTTEKEAFDTIVALARQEKKNEGTPQAHCR